MRGGITWSGRVRPKGWTAGLSRRNVCRRALRFFQSLHRGTWSDSDGKAANARWGFHWSCGFEPRGAESPRNISGITIVAAS
jgi:hypothetical protein